MSNKTQLQTNNTALDALIARVNSVKNTAASLPEANRPGGIEYEVFELNTSYPDTFYYTLPRVTHAIGCLSEAITVADADDGGAIAAIQDNYVLYYYYDTAYGGNKITRRLAPSNDPVIQYSNGQIILSDERDYHWASPMILILINDPNAPAIST